MRNFRKENIKKWLLKKKRSEKFRNLSW